MADSALLAGFRVRRARSSDDRAMAEVGCLAWRWAYKEILSSDFIEERCNLERRTEKMSQLLSRGLQVLVAETQANEVIGFAADHQPPNLSGFDCEIGALYVRPNATRFGVGRTLLAASCELFRQRGFRSMIIHTLAENPISCNFYASLGGTWHQDTEWYGYPSVYFSWNDISALADRWTALGLLDID